MKNPMIGEIYEVYELTGEGADTERLDVLFEARVEDVAVPDYDIGPGWWVCDMTPLGEESSGQASLFTIHIDDRVIKTPHPNPVRKPGDKYVAEFDEGM